MRLSCQMWIMDCWCFMIKIILKPSSAFPLLPASDLFFTEFVVSCSLAAALTNNKKRNQNTTLFYRSNHRKSSSFLSTFTHRLLLLRQNTKHFLYRPSVNESVRHCTILGKCNKTAVEGSDSSAIIWPL